MVGERSKRGNENGIVPTQKQHKKDILAYNVLGHLRNLAPLIFREVEAACHNLLPHVLWDSTTVVLGVERRVTAQHYVDDHAKRPQVTALEDEKWVLKY